MNYKLPIIVLLFVAILTSGFGCKIASKEVENAMAPITLEYWRVWDGPDSFEQIINAYNALHPFVTIKYKKLRYSEYEKELIEALAEDRGPDIFSIHNTWVRKYQTKLEPMPAEITMAYPVLKGSIKKEVIPELRTSKSISLKEIRDNFVDVVYDDVVINTTDEEGKTAEKVFVLPLALDTLAMYYNKDLLNNAGISNPPQFWNKEFQEDVKKLTKLDTQGNIVQSGAALGGGANIDRSSDILSVLMMQNGAEMMDSTGKVLFHSTPAAFKSLKFSPGLEALRFYTDFSNPAKEVYSWNDEIDSSVGMFSRGKLALMFGYAYHLPTIKAQAPKLNFSIAPLPQIEGRQEKMNFANYWVEGVSRKSKNAKTAWDFIQFATRAENVKSYLDKTKKPTALRSLVESQLEDEDIDVFANQVLTARSWYKGEDSNAVEEIFKDMINSAIGAGEELQKIISLAASRVQQTIK